MKMNQSALQTLESLLTETHDRAKGYIEANGEFVPETVLVNTEGKVISIVAAAFANEKEKKEVFVQLSRLARLENAAAVISTANAWLSPANSDVRPSKHPKREDCILTSLIFSNGKVGVELIQTYKRTGKRFRFGAAHAQRGGIQYLIPAWV
jgi:hypothetical protein